MLVKTVWMALFTGLPSPCFFHQGCRIYQEGNPKLGGSARLQLHTTTSDHILFSILPHSIKDGCREKTEAWERLDLALFCCSKTSWDINTPQILALNNTLTDFFAELLQTECDTWIVQEKSIYSRKMGSYCVNDCSCHRYNLAAYKVDVAWSCRMHKGGNHDEPNDGWLSLIPPSKSWLYGAQRKRKWAMSSDGWLVSFGALSKSGGTFLIYLKPLMGKNGTQRRESRSRNLPVGAPWFMQWTLNRSDRVTVTRRCQKWMTLTTNFHFQCLR